MPQTIAGSGGVNRKIKKIALGVSGVNRMAKTGWAGVSGVNRKVFASGIEIGALAVGSLVKLTVNGAGRDFIVVHQGLPSSIYDSSCNGTWLLMKEIFELRIWHNARLNNYATSSIHSYLNSTFLNLFDANTKAIIKQVTIPYCPDAYNNYSILSSLSCKVFLPAFNELAPKVYSATPDDGAILSYFAPDLDEAKRQRYYNGNQTAWFLRTPNYSSKADIWTVGTRGEHAYTQVTSTRGICPMLVLPSTQLTSDDMDSAGAHTLQF